MNIKQKLKYFRESNNRDKKPPILSSGNISYANWWREDPSQIWFTRFIDKNCEDGNEKIRFYSVFGPRCMVLEQFDGGKVFFTGENLEGINKQGVTIDPVALKLFQKRQRDYGDYLMGNVDVALGFECKEENNYLRFPYWLTNFRPDSDYDDIKEQVKIYNERDNTKVREGSAIIASHDQFGSRTFIYNDLKDVIDIRCEGKWNHNSDELKTFYNNNKIDYLSHKKFNICPENVDAPYYVTEKLFDAFASGAIPIYHGNGNKPETDIINQNAIIFWDFDSDNDENIKMVKRLNDDDSYYEKFAKQPAFNKNAPEIIWNYFESLRNKIKSLY